MAEPLFDPNGFYEFDLPKGSVRTRHGSRVLVLTDNVVAPLVSTAVQNGDLTAVRRLGRELGDHVSSALGGAAEAAAPELVLSHAAGVLSLFGWGALALERWGDAVVVSVASVPALDDEHLGVAALLGGMLSAISEREVACVPVDAEGHFVIVDPTVAEEVWTWSKEGADLPLIISRLAAEPTSQEIGS